MILYFGMGVFSSFLLYIATKGKKNNKFLMIISFLPFFLISALRYGIGYDYLHIYDKIFHNVISGQSTTWEFGIVLICKFVGLFSKDSFGFFVIMSFLTCSLLYWASVKQSKIPWLTFLLIIVGGFYMESFNAVRQYVAISIFIYSFKYIINRDLKKYLLLIFVASLFHSSALFLIPTYWISKIKPTPKKLFLLFGVILIALPFVNSIFLNLISHTKYAYYLVGNYSEANPTLSELIVSFVLLVVGTFFYKNNKNDKEFLFYYLLTFMFFAVSILSFKILLAYRIEMYFKICSLMFVPKLISSIKKPKDRSLFIICTLIFFSSLTLIGAYKFGWYDTKYISIFD